MIEPIGYAQEIFVVEILMAPQLETVSCPITAITLLHSGMVYPSERDPTQFFAAMRRLADAEKITSDCLKIRFRAAAHEQMLRALAQKYAIEPFIKLLPPVSYRAALEEMIRADALLVLQASNCNEQIPAKLYEYLRAGRPILVLTDPRGDTAGVLRETGLETIARLDTKRKSTYFPTLSRKSA